jgi:hypothetical protein
MARQDDIEGLLRSIAPVFRSVALDAQNAAEEFKATEWARKHLSRTAAVNQVAGTGRWRIVADKIVARCAELPHGVELSTSDGEQNQGRYYLRAPDLAILLTIRRRPHREEDKPKILQLQMTEVLAQAPIDFDDEVASTSPCRRWVASLVLRWFHEARSLTPMSSTTWSRSTSPTSTSSRRRRPPVRSCAPLSCGTSRRTLRLQRNSIDRWTSPIFD